VLALHVAGERIAVELTGDALALVGAALGVGTRTAVVHGAVAVVIETVATLCVGLRRADRGRRTRIAFVDTVRGADRTRAVVVDAVAHLGLRQLAARDHAGRADRNATGAGTLDVGTRATYVGGVVVDGTVAVVILVVTDLGT